MSEKGTKVTWQGGVSVGGGKGISATTHDPHKKIIENSNIPREFKSDFLDGGVRGVRPSYYGPYVDLFADRFLLDWFGVGGALRYGYLKSVSHGKGDYLHVIGGDLRVTFRPSAFWSLPVEAQIAAKIGYSYAAGKTTFDQGPNPSDTRLHLLDGGLLARIGYRFDIGKNWQIVPFLEGNYNPPPFYASQNIGGHHRWSAGIGIMLQKRAERETAEEQWPSTVKEELEKGEQQPMPPVTPAIEFKSPERIAVTYPEAFFKHKDSAFRPGEESRVVETANQVKQAIIENELTDKIVVVTIKGYASPEGTTAFNFDLSIRRIEAILKIFEEVFADVDQVTIKTVSEPLGESKLIAIPLGNCDEEAGRVICSRAGDDDELKRLLMPHVGDATQVINLEKDYDTKMLRLVPVPEDSGDADGYSHGLIMTDDGEAYLIPFLENRRIFIEVEVVEDVDL